MNTDNHLQTQIQGRRILRSTNYAATEIVTMFQSCNADDATKHEQHGQLCQLAYSWGKLSSSGCVWINDWLRCWRSINGGSGAGSSKHWLHILSIKTAPPPCYPAAVHAVSSVQKIFFICSIARRRSRIRYRPLLLYSAHEWADLKSSCKWGRRDAAAFRMPRRLPSLLAKVVEAAARRHEPRSSAAVLLRAIVVLLPLLHLRQVLVRA